LAAHAPARIRLIEKSDFNLWSILERAKRARLSEALEFRAFAANRNRIEILQTVAKTRPAK
jgi:hypothetical protein